MLFFANANANTAVNYSVYFNNNNAVDPNHTARVVVSNFVVTVNGSEAININDTNRGAVYSLKKSDLDNSNKINSANQQSLVLADR